MTIRLVVLGAGGFGRECLDIVAALNEAAAREPVFDILGVVDDGPSQANLSRLSDRGVAYLGQRHHVSKLWPEVSYVLGVGDPEVRHRLDAELSLDGAVPATIIHPRATIGSRVTIGLGSVLCAGSLVSTNVTIGRHVHLNAGSTIGHDTFIESFVSINPSATLSGDVTVRTGSLVGAGAVILQGLTIGANSIVGASACVTKDVTKGRIVKGIPAR